MVNDTSWPLAFDQVLESRDLVTQVRVLRIERQRLPGELVRLDDVPAREMNLGERVHDLPGPRFERTRALGDGS